MEPQVSEVLKIQRFREGRKTIMTNKINLVINMSILALLIYLSVAVKTMQEKVFPDPNIMQPAVGYDNSVELRYNIQELLNNVLKDAIMEQEQD